MSTFDARDHVDAAGTNEGLWDVLRKHERNIELKIHVAAPAEIVAYNPTTQRATVTLGFRAVEDRDDGNLKPDPPIEIKNIRVKWPQTAVSYDTHPLNAGDTGTLIFTDRALDEYYRKGGAVDPVLSRAHSLADCWFEPGLPPDSDVITPPTDQTARVVHHDTLIKLGRAAAEFIALATNIDAHFTALKTWLDTHTHVVAGVTTGPGSVTSAIAPAPSPTAQPVGSTKVQAE